MFVSFKHWLKKNSFIICASIVSVFIFVGVVFSILFLNTWFDEVNYTYKSWLTANNLAQPFLDYTNKYPTFSFYSQVLLQDLFGPSLLASRVLSGLLFALSVVLIFLLLSKFTNKWWSLFSASILFFHPYLLGFFISGVPYSLAMFLCLLGIYCLFFLKNKTFSTILSTIFFVLLLLVRYNLFPLLFVLWLIIWFKDGWKYTLCSVLGSVVLLMVSFIPFLLVDWQYAISMLVLMFGPLAKLFSAIYLPPSEVVVNQFWGVRLDVIREVFTLYYPFWLIFSLGTVGLLAKKLKTKIKFENEDFFLLFLILAVGVLFITHFLFLGNPTFTIYSLYFAPLLIMAAVVFFYKFCSQQLLLKEISFRNKYLISSFFIILMALSFSSQDFLINFSNPLHYQDSDLNRLKRSSIYLQSVSTIDDTILTLDDPHIVFLAGRKEIPELINKHFTYRDNVDTKTLERFHFYNTEMFFSWLQDRATLVVFQEEDLLDRLQMIGAADREEEFYNTLNKNYSLVGKTINAYPHKYQKGEGTMTVYKRK